eukprot:GEZU01001620.1.p1 GENE.GEZU01001620.1~~GEZU01001620.1.p1  ORF type:complete len:165 (-),score=30.11 GEZU01001620.1:283-777(-)
MTPSIPLAAANRQPLHLRLDVDSLVNELHSANVRQQQQHQQQHQPLGPSQTIMAQPYCWLNNSGQQTPVLSPQPLSYNENRFVASRAWYQQVFRSSPPLNLHLDIDSLLRELCASSSDDLSQYPSTNNNNYNVHQTEPALLSSGSYDAAAAAATLIPQTLLRPH